MTDETIFNIFIFFEKGTATEYGIRQHRLRGLDSEKLTFLQGVVGSDVLAARRFLLPRAFTAGQWAAQQRRGLDLGLFEEAFAVCYAPRAPLVCLTAVVDGIPRADVHTDLGPYWGERLKSEVPGEVQDWLFKYTDGSIFRFDDLISDDYFVAIRLLLNARHIASASKLLMSCVDTLAFVKHGDTKGNFVAWLDSYVDLAGLEITSFELWEFRNSIIHMTNLSSRAVLAGKVCTIMPYIGSDDLAKNVSSATIKPFNLYRLIVSISAGVGKWADTYNADTSKFMAFIERCDTVISDSRLSEFTSIRK